MKVLLTAPRGIDGKGGVERLMKEILRNNGRTDIRLSYLATIGEGPFIWRQAASVFYLLAYIFRLLFAPPDIVHINMSTHGSAYRKVVYVALADVFSIPVLLHIHGAGFDEFYRKQKPFQQSLIRWSFGKAWRVVVLGNFWRRFILAEGLCPEAKIRIVTNGAPDHYLQTIDRRERTGEVRIGFAGEVGERKGVSVLLEAMAPLRALAQDWHITIAGNGKIEEMRELSRRLGMSNRVTFLGWVDSADIREMFRQSDIMVLPSFAENQPISIIEAMAASLPIVSTRIAAIDEQVAVGDNGFLVAPGDKAGLERCMRALIEDGKLRVRMGWDSRRRFCEIFEFGKFMDRLFSVYSELPQEKEHTEEVYG